MPSPSNLALSAAYSQLTNATYGFNASYAAELSSFPGAPSFTIDYGATSKTFFQSQLDDDDLLDSGIVNFPCQVLFAVAGRNINVQKFMRFSGPVKVILDGYLSGAIYSATRPSRNFELWASAYESAIMNVFQNKAQQNFGPSVVYNGDFGFERLHMKRGADNWVQAIRAEITYTILIP